MTNNNPSIVETRKSERESNQALVRRFTKRLRESGILLEAKKVLFRKRPLSDQLKKRKALRRLEKRQEFEKLRKMGKI